MSKTVYGFASLGNDFKGNPYDPRFKAMADAIGIYVDPKTTKWIDKKDGHEVSQKEADQRAIKAGVAMNSKRTGGFFDELYDRNKSWIDPVATIGATVLGGPAAGALVSGGINYANNHDLGQALLSGATTYGTAGLAKGLTKIPGVGKIADKVVDVGRGIENAVPGLSTIADKVGDVASWTKSHGIKLPSVGKIVGGGGGAGGGEAAGDGGLDLLGLAGVANSAYLGGQQTSLTQDALKNASKAYDEKAPIRAMGLQGLQAAPRTLPSLGKIRMSGANPFAQG